MHIEVCSLIEYLCVVGFGLVCNSWLLDFKRSVLPLPPHSFGQYKVTMFLFGSIYFDCPCFYLGLVIYKRKISHTRKGHKGK
jgi:hypothetical protein